MILIVAGIGLTLIGISIGLSALNTTLQEIRDILRKLK